MDLKLLGVDLEDGGARRVKRGRRGDGRGNEEHSNRRGGPQRQGSGGRSDGKGGPGGREAAATAAHETSSRNDRIWFRPEST